MFVTKKRIHRIENLVAGRQDGLVLVLENIHYPHNAEAVLRTCDAFGVQDVHFIFNSRPPFNPRKIGKNTSGSANKWLTFHVHHTTAECLDPLIKDGYRMLATVVEDGKSRGIYTADLSGEKIALILGNEREGITDEGIRRSHQKIHIPMAGMVQSLNLSVAAGILLFEITRRRMASGNRAELPPGRQKQLVADYIGREQARILRKTHRYNP